MPNYFVILLKKNINLVLRSPIRLVSQISYPIILVVLWFFTVEARLTKKYDYQEFCVLPVAEKCDNEKITTYFQDKILVYSPTGNDELEKIMNQFRSTFIKVTGLKNKYNLMDYYYTQNSTNLLAAFQFSDKLAEAPILPEHLKVRVRFPGELRFKTRQHYHWRTNENFVKLENFFRHPFDGLPINPSYYREGFLTLQQALVYFILNSTENLPRIDLKRFSLPDGWQTSSIMRTAQIWTGRVFMYMNLLQFLLATKDIATERNNHFKSLTKIFGIPNWAHWSAWFVRDFLGYCYNIIILVLAVKVKWYQSALFPYSDPSVIILTLIFYSCASITMAFLIATIVSTELYALMVGLCVFVVTQMPTHFFTDTFRDLDFRSELAICLLPNTAVSIATYLMSLLENPIKYGPLSDDEPQYYDSPNSEDPTGIIVYNLTKIYNEIEIVVNLTFEAHRGQITALLGHAKCGKTTTLLMLSGLVTPTRGNVYINGLNLATRLKDAQKVIGWGPQKPYFIPELTVRDHIYFFSRLKGLGKHEAKENVKKYISILKLDQKEKARNLPEWEEKKLIIAIALSGNSKVILLDEPTAGLDLTSQKIVWDCLQNEKADRTILLSTQIISEAEKLGDRIAIIGRGELQCYGTTNFLKRTFGAGYHLSLVKKEHCNTDDVTSFFRKYLPNLQIYKNQESEMVYILKSHDEEQFVDMFTDLEQSLEKLNLRSFGITVTSLEEVLLRIAGESTKGKVSVPTATLLKKKSKNFTGNALIFSQLKAMSYKLVCAKKTYWMVLILQVCLPSFWVAAHHFQISRKASFITNISLTLEKQYHTSTVLIKLDQNYTGMVDRFYMNTINESAKYLVVNDPNKVFLDFFTRYPNKKELQPSIGASISNTVITAWFSGEGIHASAISLGLILDSMYKLVRGKNHSIRFINHPFLLKTEAIIENKYLYCADAIINSTSFAIAISTCLSLAFYMNRNSVDFRIQQITSGANIFILWFTTFVFELILFGITLSLMTLLVLASSFEGFSTARALGCYYGMSFSFGMFSIGLLLLLSLIFKRSEYSLLTMQILTIFAGIVLALVAYQSAAQEDKKDSVLAIFHISPIFTFCYSLNNVEIMSDVQTFCKRARKKCRLEVYDAKICECIFDPMCCEISRNYIRMEFPGVGKQMLFLSFLAIGMILLVILIDYCRYYPSFFAILKRKDVIGPSSKDEDDDVIAHRLEFAHTTDESNLPDKYIIVMKDLTKYYRKVAVVDDVCLGMSPFECFGLLGVCGSGKSTIIKMIVGQTRPSSGDIWIDGVSVTKRLPQAIEMVGYCPEFGGLPDYLKPIEVLRMNSMLRGVPTERRRQQIKYLAQVLGIEDDMRCPIKYLNIATRRKVELAVALVADPPVLILDEPTKGMDPRSTRDFWNLLVELREKGKCIIIGSQSVQECEALCTRLTIIVNGRLRCLGFVQHLKQRFTAGAFLSMQLEKGATHKDKTAIQHYIENNFANPELVESGQNSLNFYIPYTIVPWSTIFGIMKYARNNFAIEDYSLGQCSLEQVFLKFTKNQR